MSFTGVVYCCLGGIRAFLLLKSVSFLVYGCWEESSMAESRSKDCLRGELTWGVESLPKPLNPKPIK